MSMISKKSATGIGTSIEKNCVVNERDNYLLDATKKKTASGARSINKNGNRESVKRTKKISKMRCSVEKNGRKSRIFQKFKNQIVVLLNRKLMQ